MICFILLGIKRNKTVAPGRGKGLRQGIGPVRIGGFQGLLSEKHSDVLRPDSGGATESEGADQFKSSLDQAGLPVGRQV